MKIVAVLVARMTSSRLPGKPMLLLSGKTSIERHIERFRMVKGINEIYIATSKSSQNKNLFSEAERLNVKIYAGEDEDVVERFVAIGEKTNADALIRVGCDKPLFCYELLQNNLSDYKGEDLVCFKGGLTVGVGHELLSLQAMKEVHKYYHGTAISQYIREHPHKFKIKTVNADAIYKRPEYRIALDTSQDYELLKIIFENIKCDEPIHTKKVMLFLDDNPKKAAINKLSEEKEVNTYIKELENKPIFKVFLNDENRYIIQDRSGSPVEYEEFIKYVSDKKRFKDNSK